MNNKLEPDTNIFSQLAAHTKELLPKQNDRKPLLIAIDGRSGAGKTSFALALKEKYNWSIFHADRFFLRPEQRTPERLTEAGGNMDRERLLEEVILPIKKGTKLVSYRPFDCRTMQLSEPLSVTVGEVCVIEGSYSCHPDLWEYYDLHIFLDVSREEQKKRILKRNGAAQAAVFEEKWIPLEEKYFLEYNICERCEMRFNAPLKI